MTTPQMIKAKENKTTNPEPQPAATSQGIEPLIHSDLPRRPAVTHSDQPGDKLSPAVTG